MTSAFRAPPRRPRLLPALAALLLLAPAAALAETQTFLYRLKAAEKPVGTRDARIVYVPSETGEVRLLQSFTKFSVPLAGTQYTYVQRLGGRFGGARSFAASIEDNGQVREVQGYLSEAGQWVVTVVEKGQSKTWYLPAEDVDLTSAELMDPDRASRVLQSATTLRVLATETGGILTGPVEDLGLQEQVVGQQAMNVHRFRWSPPGGDMVLSYDDDGYLVSYEVDVVGRRMGARLDAAPPGRTYGGALDSTLTQETVREQEL